MKIQRREPGDRYPLSFAQHRLWFIDQLSQGHRAYNVGRAMRLRGRLNRTALDGALTEIVSRHEILRTTYHAVNGIPMQQIAPAGSVHTPVQDLSGEPAAQDERELLRIVDQDIRRPFDLASDWPIRTLLLQLAPDEHVFVITVHHIATDSMTIVLNELSALYEAGVSGKAVSLPALAVQYADYAIWERSLLTGSYLERLTEYWRKQLDGAPHTLDLPADLPRQQVLGTDGGRHYFAMENVPLAALDTLIRSEKSTRFTTWLTAFGVLLMHYTGQQDILISGPVACRELPELEPLIGCFANTIVFRLDLSGSPSFREMLGRAGRTVWGALAHRRLPFHLVVDIAKPARNSSRVPLVQVNFRVAAPDVFTLAGLDGTWLPVGSSGSKFELAAQVSESADGFLDYNTDLFSVERISVMARDLETLMSQLIARPDAPISAAELRPVSGIGPRPIRPGLPSLARMRKTINIH